MEIPFSLQRSPFLRQGGFSVFEGLPALPVCEQLLAEALRSSRSMATRCDVPPSADQPERGGAPGRRLLSAPGGQVQGDFYHSPQVLEFLRDLTHLKLQSSGARGSYSFYLRGGDRLDLHRDVEDCEVAVITCLYDNFATHDGGGLLSLYPSRIREPLRSIRESPDRERVRIKLLPRQTIVMCGGLIPHEVEPMARGQVRIISVLCYC
jgi:hypothetical protein